ncbi:hypothetical protein L3X38_012532 [Prunus dulcis]|uniref:Uncharacterized protein n=1 Tax=Prunus dulcis TaxID=3755 RepID=A0AAD4WJN1_PRUDU|nr:hypothetical protein L3X38_012532 [Prunus dulcis]
MLVDLLKLFKLCNQRLNFSSMSRGRTKTVGEPSGMDVPHLVLQLGCGQDSLFYYPTICEKLVDLVKLFKLFNQLLKCVRRASKNKKCLAIYFGEASRMEVPHLVLQFGCG